MPVLLFALAVSAASAQVPAALEEEAPATLLAIGEESPDVELLIGGSWSGTTTGSIGISLTEIGVRALESEAPLLFTQEIDLTLALTLFGKWTLEASFLDDYELNTYRAFYRGEEGEAVRYVGIGNAGLDFPSLPSADVSGATPSSFGAYAAFGSGDLGLHALVRYDSAAREERIYVGERERSIVDLDVAQRLRGRSFVLPDQNIEEAPTVYLEDPKGSITGSDGRRYRIANAQEQAVSATLGLVELTAVPAGRVAVSYEKGGASPWSLSMGSYGAGGTGTGFLGQTQTAFEASGEDVQLAAQPQPGGGDGIPATVTIGGAPALVVFEAGTFSPFEVANRYGLPAAAASGSYAELVFASTGQRIDGFTVEATPDGKTYTLVADGAASDQRAAAFRFPLASIDPSPYLMGGKGSSIDAVARFISYGPPSGYAIGTDVAAGSVIVTRGGLRDPLARFDADTGVVVLSSPATAGELIRVSFLRNARDRRFGSLVAGVGAVYEPDDAFSARAGATLRWNVSGEAFTTEDEPSPGTAGLSAGAVWRTEHLRADIFGAATYETVDTTGLYRAAGMEGDERSLELSEGAASEAEPPTAPNLPSADAATLFVPYGYAGIGVPDAANTAPLTYRDYAMTDILGNKVLNEIGWSDAERREDKTGPYPVRVGELNDATAWVAEYRLGTGAAENGGFGLWAGFQMALEDDAKALAQARSLIVPNRYYGLEGSAAVRAYIQIGALADEEENAESPELVWTGPLHSAAVDATSGASADGSTAWATWTFDLDDADRAQLGNSRALRVLVRLESPLVDPGPSVAASGRLLVLAPRVQGAAYRPTVEVGGTIRTAGDEVRAAQVADPSLKTAFPEAIGRLHPDGESQRVLRVAWSNLDVLAPADVAAGADGYAPAFPLASYRKLSFYIKGPRAADPADGAALAATTVRIKIGPSASRTPYLSARIPAAHFEPDQWAKIDLEYSPDAGIVRINGDRVSDASVIYRKAGAEEIGRYLSFSVEPPAGTALVDGSISIDELALEDPVSGIGARAGGGIEWKRPGSLIELGSFPLLSDLVFAGRAETGMFGDLGDPGAALTGASRFRSETAATVLGAGIQGRLGLGNDYWNAGHTVTLPLGPLSVSERFDLDPYAQYAEQELRFALAGPVPITAAASHEREGSARSRRWRLSMNAPTTQKDLDQTRGRSFNATAALQVKYRREGEDPLSADTYFKAWTDSWSRLVPDSGEDERTRDFSADLTASVTATPIGIETSAAGSASFSAAQRRRHTAVKARLALPIALGDFSLTPSWERGHAGSIGAEAGGAADDAMVFAAAFGDYSRLWSLLPYLALFDPAPAAAFDEAAATYIGANFSDSAEIALKIPGRKDWTALLVPASIGLWGRRDLSRTLETVSDIGEYGVKVAHSAINLFGAFGAVPLFNAYKSDEFSQEAAYSIRRPAGDDASYSLSLTQRAAFYGFSGSSLVLSGVSKTESIGWSQDASIAWRTPVRTNLLGTLLGIAVEQAARLEEAPYAAVLASEQRSFERTESLHLSFADREKTVWSWKLRHDSVARIGSALSAGAFALLSGNGGSERTTDFLAQLGLSLTVRF